MNHRGRWDSVARPYRRLKGQVCNCQPNLEMSSSSQSRNVRFMFRRLPDVPLVPAATASATDGLVWA